MKEFFNSIIAKKEIWIKMKVVTEIHRSRETENPSY